MKYLLKWSHYSLNTHFEWEKLSFDDFLMMTWEREDKSQIKKNPQIPHLSVSLVKTNIDLFVVKLHLNDEYKGIPSNPFYFLGSRQDSTSIASQLMFW